MNQKAVQLSGFVIFGVVAAAGAAMVYLSDRPNTAGPLCTVNDFDMVALVEEAMRRAGDDARRVFRSVRRTEVRASYCNGATLEDATKYMNIEYGGYDPDDRIIPGVDVRRFCRGGGMKVQASVARCLRTPPNAARR